MFRNITNAIASGRSPLLLTAIEGDRIGSVAVIDGQQRFGDAELICELESEETFPTVKNGVLIERITTPPHLILCGAGHVSVYVAKIAKLVGFKVTVIDERKDFANRERFEQADQILNLPFDEALDQIDSPNAYYVIVTQ